MTLEELTAAVADVVQDPAWDSDRIAAILNRGYRTVATGVLQPGKYQLTPPLPELYTVDTIVTEAGSGICDLPDDFNRNVVQVGTLSGEAIPVEPSFVKFLKDNPGTDTGSIHTCAVHGNRLLYRDIPSAAETLTIHYYRVPDMMADDDDEPVGIPEQLRYPLLVGFACAHIFSLIEDGLDGNRANTNYWKQEYTQGLLDMELVLGFDGHPEYIGYSVTDRIA